MSNNERHESPSIKDGTYIEFQKAVLTALPRPGTISKDVALEWKNNGKKLTEYLARLAQSPNELNEPKENHILRLISEGQDIRIAPVSGARMLKNSGKLFSGHLDPCLARWDASGKSKKTPLTPIDVYEQIAGKTFRQMFTSLSEDLNKLCLTEHQIEEFCKSHRDWLHPNGYATFFLYKRKGKFFVAYVRFDDPAHLWVDVSEFDSGVVWDTDLRYRVVIPKS